MRERERESDTTTNNKIVWFLLLKNEILEEKKEDKFLINHTHTHTQHTLTHKYHDD